MFTNRQKRGSVVMLLLAAFLVASAWGEGRGVTTFVILAVVTAALLGVVAYGNRAPSRQ